MLWIFDDFLAGNIDGNASVNRLYSDKYLISMKWISSPDMTVQDIVDDICDSYELEGYDLEVMPVTRIGDRFHLYEPQYEIPPEYNQLLETKAYVEKQITEAKQLGYDKSIVSFMEDTLDTIVNRIKGLQ